VKPHILILIVFLGLIAQPAGAQQAQEPLTKDEIMDLVKAGMETPALVKLIHEHGMDFDLSNDYDYIRALLSAGAKDPVFKALRAARPKPLSGEQVLRLVVGHVPSERATMLVKQHGIDFLVDEEYLKTLRLAGGDDTLIAALSKARNVAIAIAPATVRQNPHDGLKYVWIPPGTFMMGCSAGDSECDADEKP
jgi:hypothetical protein